MKTLDQAMYEAVTTVSPAEVGEAVERDRIDELRAKIESGEGLTDAESEEYIWLEHLEDHLNAGEPDSGCALCRDEPDDECAGCDICDDEDDA